VLKKTNIINRYYLYCPELRGIERYLANMKRKLKLVKGPVRNDQNFKEMWNRVLIKVVTRKSLGTIFQCKTLVISGL
jgi:hypothetical protein